MYYTNYISEKEKEDDEANSTELLRFVPQDNSGENIWEKSTPYITSYGALTTLISRTKDKRKKLYFNIEKQIDNLSTYLIIKQATYKTSQIIIENYSSYISFCVSSTGLRFISIDILFCVSSFICSSVVQPISLRRVFIPKLCFI